MRGQCWNEGTPEGVGAVVCRLQQVSCETLEERNSPEGADLFFIKRPNHLAHLLAFFSRRNTVSHIYLF